MHGVRYDNVTDTRKCLFMHAQRRGSIVRSGECQMLNTDNGLLKLIKLLTREFTEHSLYT